MFASPLLLTLLSLWTFADGLSDCWHFYDRPIDVCFAISTNETNSYRYKCNTNTSQDHFYVTLERYNGTESCLGNPEKVELVYNFTTETDEKAKATNVTEYVSCNGYKPCAYFKGRYYLTLELTDAPTSAPTHSPTFSPTMSPTDVPTAFNHTKPPSPDPSMVPTMEPTYNPTYIPTLNPFITDDPTAAPTFAPTLSNNLTRSPTSSPTRNYTTLNPEYPFLANETCARAQEDPYDEYFQDIIYIIDECLPYSYYAVYNGTNLTKVDNPNGWFPAGSMFMDNDTQAVMNQVVSETNDTIYLSRTCYEDAFGNPLSISSALYLSSV